MNMPRGTFKNKLADNQPAYKFSSEELQALYALLRGMAEDIGLVAGYEFNSALSKAILK